MTIGVSLQLEVLANNKILVPGCEPTSALSSNKLSSWLAQSGCNNCVMVDLQTALNNIPGSYVKFGSNFNRGGTRQRWFVLPPKNNDCPCVTTENWYRVLRDSCTAIVPETENYDMCDVIGMGYCPSPDFGVDYEAPQHDTYKPEGSFPPGVGVLPPIPYWSVK